jgi:dihydroxy-acid dehydratase
MNAKITSDLSRAGPHLGHRNANPPTDLRKFSAVRRNLNEGGRYLAKDVCHHLGSAPLQARTLLDKGCVTGPTVVEKLRTVRRNEDQCVVRPVDQPLSATRGNNGLTGSLMPACAVKAVGMAGLKRTGPARFDGEEARGGIVNKKYREGEVLVIRYAGPHGGPGVRNVLAHGAVTREGCHAEI